MLMSEILVVPDVISMLCFSIGRIRKLNRGILNGVVDQEGKSSSYSYYVLGCRS